MPATAARSARCSSGSAKSTRPVPDVIHHSLATLAPGCKTSQMTAQATSASSRPGTRGAAGRPARRRDPGRKERILVAAAALGARRGFDAISMADIGAEAGIVGSGVYRHFDSKTAILVAMADRVMDRLMSRSAEIIAAGLDEGQSLTLLVRDHIEVALTDRDALAVYHREVRTLPEDERRRLSRAQRHYIEEWVHLLAPL